jgi:tetratricopeptide (TPR) repeat protein
MPDDQFPEANQQTIGTKKKWGFICILFIIVLALGLAGGFKAYQKHQARQAQLHFTAAEELYNYKKYQEAVQEYELVATKYPRSEYVTTCWYKAGYIYRQFLLNDAAAAKALQKLMDLFPYNQYRKETLVLLVDIYARLGKYKEQNDTIKRLLAEFPNEVNADALRLEFSKSAMRLGQTKEALEQLALIKDKNANVVKNSQEYYQLLSTEDPFDPQPHLELARIYKGMGLQQRASIEFETAKWIKKNAAAVKAAQQKPVVPSKYARGFTQKKVPPKIKLLPKEEKLYIGYALAQNKDWPAEMYKKSQSLGTPKNEQEAKVFSEKMQKFETEWWSGWYAKNQTTYNECEKIKAKVVNDQGTAILLNERVAKITK